MTIRRVRIKKKPIIIFVALIIGIIALVNIFGENGFKVDLSSAYVNIGANFTNDFKATYKNMDVTKEVMVDLKELDTSKPGIYNIVFVYEKGGKKYEDIHQIEVKDLNKPVIELIGSSEINVLLNGKYVEPGYKANDDIDGDITSGVKATNDIDVSKEGTYMVTYTAYDKAGNVETVTRKVIVSSISPLKMNKKEFSLNGYFSNSLLPSNDGVANYLDGFIFAGDSIALYYVINKQIPGTRLWHQVSINSETALTTSIYINHQTTGLTFIEAFRKYKPKKVIFTLGSNAAYMESEYFIACYKKLINGIKEASPDTLLIIQSIPPVASKYDIEGKALNNDKINKLNYYLLELCSELDIPFLNSAEVLKDSNGALKEGYYIEDGVHPTKAGQTAMYNYAKNHAVSE